MILSAAYGGVNLLDIVAIAHNAGKTIMSVYKDPSVWDVQHKADHSPVTLADKQAHEYIAAQLSQLYPQIPILSEEGAHEAYDIRKEWQLFWCVDPLDGTKEFLKKNGQFTVNIGLCKDHKVVAGVVQVPATQEVYYAAQGLGTHYRVYGESDSILQEESFLKANTFDWKQEKLTVIGSRSHHDALTSKFISQFSNPQVVLAGSSLKFCMVAHGKADLYPRLAPTCEWDTCAAQIIVEEAGGRVLQLTNKGEITNDAVAYNKPSLLNPFFLVMGAVQLPSIQSY